MAMEIPTGAIRSAGNNLDDLSRRMQQLSSKASSISNAISGCYMQGGVGGRPAAAASRIRNTALEAGRRAESLRQAANIYADTESRLSGVGRAAAGTIKAGYNVGWAARSAIKSILFESVKIGATTAAITTTTAVLVGKTAFQKYMERNITVKGGAIQAGGTVLWDKWKNAVFRGDDTLNKIEAKYEEIPEGYREILKDTAKVITGSDGVAAWELFRDTLHGDLSWDTLGSGLKALGTDGTKASGIVNAINTFFECADKNTVMGELENARGELEDLAVQAWKDGNKVDFLKYEAESLAAGWAEVSYGVTKTLWNTGMDYITKPFTKFAKITESVTGTIGNRISKVPIPGFKELGAVIVKSGQETRSFTDSMVDGFKKVFDFENAAKFYMHRGK